MRKYVADHATTIKKKEVLQKMMAKLDPLVQQTVVIRIEANIKSRT